jgi:hypothetical protein
VSKLCCVDLSQKVETTRDEQNQLAAENEVLVKYINNLMQQYGNTMDTSNKKTIQSTSVTGKLNRLFGRSNATSSNISSDSTQSGIGGPGGGIVGRGVNNNRK